jgi:hypothetical protein
MDICAYCRFWVVDYSLDPDDRREMDEVGSPTNVVGQNRATADVTAGEGMRDDLSGEIVQGPGG